MHLLWFNLKSQHHCGQSVIIIERERADIVQLICENLININESISDELEIALSVRTSKICTKILFCN